MFNLEYNKFSVHVNAMNAHTISYNHLMVYEKFYWLEVYDGYGLFGFISLRNKQK